MFGSNNSSKADKADAAPANGFSYQRLSIDDAVVLFIDHQAGLSTLCRDQPASEFTNNVMALAKNAKYFNLPVILTTSMEQGPNGPLMPELKDMFPKAPYIARPGEINAWDNADFVKAIKKTGRKQLIIAGIVTEVCVAFPALSAREAGYEVFVITDASGTFNELSRQTTWLRLQQAGVQLLTWFAMSGELRRDWRHDPAGYAKLFYETVPSYKPLIDISKG